MFQLASRLRSGVILVSSVGAGASGKEKLELLSNVGDSFAHGVSSCDSSMENAG
jgi:hypothetical protein